MGRSEHGDGLQVMPFISIYHHKDAHGSQTQYKQMKRKKNATRELFNDHFAVFWVQKEVAGSLSSLLGYKPTGQ